MNANKLNDYYLQLLDRYDHIDQKSVPIAQTKPITDAFSEWEDFYWGNYEQWPVNKVSIWNTKMQDIDDALTEVEKVATHVEPTPVTAITRPEDYIPTVGVKDITRPSYIYGTWPLWMKVAAGSVLAIGLYAVVRKLKIL